MEVYEKLGKDKILNPFSKINHPAGDKNIYSFTNLISGEIFTGTRCEMEVYSETDVSFLFKERPSLTSSDWCLSHKVNEARSSSRNDYRVYSFVNKSGEIFCGTKIEFKRKTGTCPSPLFLTAARKTHKGWSLSPQQSE